MDVTSADGAGQQPIPQIGAPNARFGCDASSASEARRAVRQPLPVVGLGPPPLAAAPQRGCHRSERRQLQSLRCRGVAGGVAGHDDDAAVSAGRSVSSASVCYGSPTSSTAGGLCRPCRMDRTWI